jgi:hypothetical protein
MCTKNIKKEVSPMRHTVMRPWHGRALLAGLVIGGVCVLGGPPPSVAEPNQDTASGVTAASAPDSGAIKAATAGQWVHVDPETGQVGAPPPASALGAAIAADPAFSTSHEGLVVEPAPGGGEMVDLQGRFNSAVWARVKPDGSVVTGCVPAGVPVPKE